MGPRGVWAASVTCGALGCFRCKDPWGWVVGVHVQFGQVVGSKTEADKESSCLGWRRQRPPDLRLSV